MFEYFPVEEEIQERQKCLLFKSFVKVLYKDPAPILRISKPSPIFISARYQEFADKVKEFPIKNSDVWLSSYPKTGTTFTAELLRVLHHGMNEEADLFLRVPFFELNILTEFISIDLLEVVRSLPEPRLIKTHLQINLLPKDLLTSNAKIIYVLRNPKDTAISYYHHHININCWQNSDLKVFLEDFLTGTILYGSYFAHAEEYLRLAKLMDNVLIIKYEDMVANMKGVVSKVSKFLGMSRTDDELTAIADYMHFDQMKMRKTSNMEHAVTHVAELQESKTGFKFLRKGKVGSFKDEMPEEFHQKFDEETRKWKCLSELYPN